MAVFKRSKSLNNCDVARSDNWNVSFGGQGVIGSLKDPLAPISIPREIVNIGTTWERTITDVDRIYDFGKMPIIKAYLNTFKGVRELKDPELHVIWTSYCPAEVNQNLMTVSMYFTPNVNGAQLLYSHRAPMHLPAHHIFYPRQTIAFGPNRVLPWGIGIEIEDLQIDKSFKIGKLQMFLKGSLVDGTNYTKGRDSELIIMAPVEDIHGDISKISRPRVFGQTPVVGGYKIGSFSRSESIAVNFLQGSGIDVEGLMMTKKLSAALKAVKEVDSCKLTRAEIKSSLIRKIRDITAK